MGRTDEAVLADIKVDGQVRKVMIQANKNGFMYVLDRTNCKLIAAHRDVKVNWASQVDTNQVLSDVQKRFQSGEEVEMAVARHQRGAVAFDPTAGSSMHTGT